MLGGARLLAGVVNSEFLIGALVRLDDLVALGGSEFLIGALVRLDDLVALGGWFSELDFFLPLSSLPCFSSLPRG